MRGFLAYYGLSRQYMPTEHKPGNMILMYNSQGSKLQPTKQGTKWKKKIQIKYRENPLKRDTLSIEVTTNRPTLAVGSR